MKYIIPVALLCSLSNAATANENNILIERWKPIVLFAGNGNPHAAINHLRGINEIQALMAERTSFDPQSQKFVDDLWASLNDFNLARFHSILPEVNGDWRELKVKGRREGGEYCFTDQTGKMYSPAGAMATLGDSSLLVRSKLVQPATTSDKSIFVQGTHYVIDGQWEIGWGSYSWQAFRDTVNESVKLLSPASKEDLKALSPDTLRAIDKMNPSLGEEDLEILAPLWVSFPNQWELFSSFGTIKDIVSTNPTSKYKIKNENKNLKDVSIVIAMDKEKIEDFYPSISGYIERVDDLMKVSLSLYNKDGRVMGITFDSTSLTLQIDMLLDGDALIPVENGTAKTENPVRFADESLQFTAIVDATIDVFGVTTDVENIRSLATYVPQGDGLHVDLTMNSLPEVSVHGAAFGLMPTRFIDAVLPTNIDKIILEFAEIAVKGNDGKGIVASIDMKNTITPGVTNLKISGASEALDNLFVRLGVSIISQRLLPNTKQGEELIAMVRAAREAFNADLARYEKAVNTSTIARLDH